MRKLLDKIKRATVNNRVFQYGKGEVSLSFTLNIESKQNLSDFLECLQAGAEDVRECLLQLK